MPLTVNAHATDPTHTETLRSRYESATSRRFRELNREVQTEILDNGALDDDPGIALPVFLLQLERLADSIILEIDGRAANGEALGRIPWQDQYVDPAYRSGVTSGRRNLGGIGFEIDDLTAEAALSLRLHVANLGALQQQNFDELQKIVRDMNAEVARSLREAFVPPDVPDTEEAAALVGDRIEKKGRTPGRVMARTMTIVTFTNATLNEYERLGLPAVTAEVEFVTAGDERVCAQCEALEGQTFTIPASRGIIPVHPRCRCAWLPVL